MNQDVEMRMVCLFILIKELSKNLYVKDTEIGKIANNFIKDINIFRESWKVSKVIELDRGILSKYEKEYLDSGNFPWEDTRAQLEACKKYYSDKQFKGLLNYIENDLGDSLDIAFKALDKDLDVIVNKIKELNE